MPIISLKNVEPLYNAQLDIMDLIQHKYVYKLAHLQPGHMQIQM